MIEDMFCGTCGTKMILKATCLPDALCSATLSCLLRKYAHVTSQTSHSQEKVQALMDSWGDKARGSLHDTVLKKPNQLGRFEDRLKKCLF